MSCPAEKDFVLAGFVTIDHSTGLFDALGMLKKARAMYPDAASHADRETALANCLTAGVTQATIVGYGEPGMAYTGSGSFRGGDDQHIGPGNFGSWDANIAPLHQPGSTIDLNLCCCYTGAGAEAPAVLHRLAKALNGTVCAPTGMVLYDHNTDKFDLEEGTSWQVATPTLEPDIVAVLHPYETEMPSYLAMTVAYEEHQFAIDAIMQLRYVDTTGAIRPQTWRGDDVFARLPYFGVEKRRIAKGVPLDLCTGRVELTIQMGSRAKEVRVFDVLSDRVLSDTKFPNVYYYANVDELRASLE